MNVQENTLLDLQLEALISTMEPFQIDHEGEEVIEKFGRDENKQIKLNGISEYDIEATIHVQPVYISSGVKAENEPDTTLYRNDVTVIEAVIFQGDEMLLATPEQNKRLEAAIENKVTVFQQPE